MNNKLLTIASAEDMEALGARLAQACSGAALITLQGELGTGKTTLVRGLLHGLGHRGKVKSPTYTLVEPYELGERRVYHFDLYRLGAAEELDDIGLRDYLDADALCLVEWPERGAARLPEPDLQIVLDYAGSARTVSLVPRSARGQTLLQTFDRLC
jgi:tRNA threonylcarbamoyladenosine biosynthesis protein TsaE